MADGKPPTFPRTYTMRLCPPDEGQADRNGLWDKLFATHYAVNAGARAFGEFLLDMRGGLSPDLSRMGLDRIKDDAKRRLALAGRRRMLALGWLSVEDDHGAGDHPHALPESSGQPLPRDVAEKLLRQILETKGVTDRATVDEWCDDCLGALTAAVRDDTVWVNRAESYRNLDSGPSPDQAFKILERLLGKNFLDLSLGKETRTRDRHRGQLGTDEGEDGEDKEEWRTTAASGNDPSENARQLICDLFGTGQKGDFRKTAGFAAKVKNWVNSLGDYKNCDQPSLENRIRETFRSVFSGGEYPSFPSKELKKSRPKPTSLYPQECVSGKKPGKLARRVRKLLVYLKVWDQMPGVEDGTIRDNRLHALVNEIDSACDEEIKKDRTDLKAPSWAPALLSRLEKASGIKLASRQQGSPSAGEFRILFAVLAARRLSQTQSWTRLNEMTRHEAQSDLDSAKSEIDRLDPKGKARGLLERWEDRRRQESGTRGEYRITRAAISALDDVLEAWATSTGPEERIGLLPEVQSRAEKFGDASFFEWLARTDNECLWKHASTGAISGEIITNWVKKREAEAAISLVKIPRYCHPDPFLHPVWCEFGNSKPDVRYFLRNELGQTNKRRKNSQHSEDLRNVELLLVNDRSGTVGMERLRWASDRLWKDLGVAATQSSDALARNDRLSRAALGLSTGSYRPIYPFTGQAKKWNARLQVDRNALEELRGLWDNRTRKWTDEGRRAHQVRWFLSFSPDLKASAGPWHRFVENNRDILNDLSTRPYKDKKTDELRVPLPWGKLNRKENRKGRAQLVLCRLPGLRVLSVDLGHRHAAACAVWETLSTAQINQLCYQHHQPPPGPSSLYHVYETSIPDTDGCTGEVRKLKRLKPKQFIYRRIGPDRVNGREHPAPWARLVRQFVIPLQGEKDEPRWPTEEEKRLAHTLRLTLELPESKVERPVRFDELMSGIIDMLERGIDRHKKASRVAYNLTAREIVEPGGKLVPVDGTDRYEVISSALKDWYSLASSPGLYSNFAREIWNAKCAGLKGGRPVPAETAADEPEKVSFSDLAKGLAESEHLTRELHDLWAGKWHENQPKWRPLLKEIRRRLVPSSGFARNNKRLLRHVGGLRLDRITLFQRFHRLQLSYRDCPPPEESGIKKGAENSTHEHFGQRLLDDIDRMRENRVKQLASRIVEAALGIGREPADSKRRREQTPGRGDHAPCHAIVIENLAYYRPSEEQTRRENRQLMSWSSARIRKYLQEACLLNGVLWYEIWSAYSSRQDSRTGAFGLRCRDIPVASFVDPQGFLRDHLRRVKLANSPEATMLRELEARWNAATRVWKVSPDEAWQLSDDGRRWAWAGPKPQMVGDRRKVPDPVRIPWRGGEIFVSSNERSPAAKGVNADMNAAANLGLRVLLDPDWPGAWWYWPARLTGKGRVPVDETCKGSACFPAGYEIETGESKEETVNLWRDITCASIESGGWQEYAGYSAQRRNAVINILRKHNGL